MRGFRVCMLNHKITNEKGFEIIFPTYLQAAEAAEKYVRPNLEEFTKRTMALQELLPMSIKALEDRCLAYPNLAQIIVPFASTIAAVRRGMELVDSKEFGEYSGWDAADIEKEIGLLHIIRGVEKMSYTNSSKFEMIMEQESSLPFPRTEFVNKLHEYRTKKLMEDKQFVFQELLRTYKGNAEFLNYLTMKERYSLRLLQGILRYENILNTFRYYIERVEIVEEETNEDDDIFR